MRDPRSAFVMPSRRPSNGAGNGRAVRRRRPLRGGIRACETAVTHAHLRPTAVRPPSGSFIGACVALALAAAALPACRGEGGGAPARVLDVSPRLAASAWETAFDPSEMTVTRRGVVNTVTVNSGGGLEFVPLAGARVELLAPNPAGGLPLVPVAETVADDEGRFEVGPGPASRWVLRPSVPGYATGLVGRADRVPGVLRLGDGPLTLGVRRSISATVELRDPAGRPLPDVSVHFEAIAFLATATTDEDGRATVSVPVDESVVVHGAEPSTSALVQPLEPESLRASSPAAPVVVDVPPWAPVRGWVVRAADDRRLAGAVVLSVNDPEARAVTDERGEFELATSAGARLIAIAEGFVSLVAPAPPAGELELRVRSAATAIGTVVDAGGNPVPAARVSAAWRTPDGHVQRLQGPLTDERGRFEMSWLPQARDESAPGTSAAGESAPAIVAYRRGLGWSQAVRLSGGADAVALRLAAPRVVHGTVVVRGGARLADDAWVEARVDDDVLSDAEMNVLGMEGSAGGTVGQDGRFAVHGLPGGRDGTLLLHVDGASVESRLRGVGPIDVELAFDTEVRGVVHDTDGAPVGPGTIHATAVDHPQFAGLTRGAEIQADGTFTVPDLPAGRYVLTSRVRGYDVIPETVDTRGVDAGAVVLTAERPGPLTIEVEVPRGSAPVPIDVVLASLDDPARRRSHERIEVGSPLRVVFPDVRRGRYRVSVSGGRLRGEVAECVVPDGEREPVRVVTEARLVRRGFARHADGRAVVGALVRVYPVGRRTTPESFATGEGGGFEMTGLSAGTWVAKLDLPGAPMTQTRFEVDGSAESGPDVVVEVPPHGVLRVLMRDERDERVVSVSDEAGRPLFAWGEGVRMLSRFRPRGGEVRVRGVRAGTVRVVAGSGAAETVREAVVRPGEETEVRFR